MKEELELLQNVQIEILDTIVKVCEDQGIEYSLYAGTLLGAVRHKGFIPWDDDLDIYMTRENYNRFIEAWHECKPQGFILQNKENSRGFTQSFTKIRKDHTTFLQENFERNKYHLGIFVDVFPIDRIPNGKIKRMYFKWNCMRYQLFTREFVPPKSGKGVKTICKMMLEMTNSDRIPEKRLKLLRKITKYNGDKSLNMVAIDTINSMNCLFPSNMLDNFVELDFAGKKYKCIEMWDVVLTRMYGDYMILPPENERVWKHHPIILNYEYNYEEL